MPKILAAKPPAMRIRMHYRPTGEMFIWTIQREGSASAGHWTFTDNDGYTRFGGDNWAELVERFSLTAANYDCTHNVS